MMHAKETIRDLTILPAELRYPHISLHVSAEVLTDWDQMNANELHEALEELSSEASTHWNKVLLL
jgi:hypothetical protein